MNPSARRPVRSMAGAAQPPPFWAFAWAGGQALARLILGGEMNLQAPPNLSPQAHGLLIRAGINDWGGISPLTMDYVNPEAPWPHIDELRETCEAEASTLAPRLPIYEPWTNERFVDVQMLPVVRGFSTGQDGAIAV